MQHHIGPVTREALSWHNAGVSPNHITKRDFEKSIEGEWIGLYSYLGWADFEALRDNNPAVLEANRAGHLRDYLGGPQQLTIQLQAPESDPDYSSPESTPDKVISKYSHHWERNEWRTIHFQRQTQKSLPSA